MSRVTLVPPDESPDGLRFLMIEDSSEAIVQPASMVVILNWFEELRKKAVDR